MEQIKLATILRKALKGRPLAQIAVEAGISKSLLHDWVSAARKPSGKNMPQLKRLANYLGMSLDEILFGEPSQKTIISTTRFTDAGIEYLISIEKLKK